MSWQIEIPPAPRLVTTISRHAWNRLFLVLLGSLLLRSPGWAQPPALARSPEALVPVSDTPWNRHTIDATSNGADGVKLFDIDRDGRLDIVTPWEEGGVVRIYRHPGRRNVRQQWPQATVAAVASAEDALAVSRTPHDGIGIVTCTEGSSRQLLLSVPQDANNPFSNATASSWATAPIPAATVAPQSWMFAVSGQLDNDPFIELIAGSKGQRASITKFHVPLERTTDGSDGAPAAPWQDQQLREAGWIMTLDLVDLDGDGDLDCLYSDRRGPQRGVGWLENPGPEAVAKSDPWPDHPVGAADVEVMFVQLADLTGNRRSDLVVMTLAGHLRIFTAPRMPTDDWTEARLPFPHSFQRGKGVACGDLNGDGHLDLAITTEDGCVGWYDHVRVRPEGASARRFHRINGREGWKYDLVHLLDLDEDGDLDVLTCEERHNLGIVWYENPGHPAKVESPADRSATRP